MQKWEYFHIWYQLAARGWVIIQVNDGENIYKDKILLAPYLNKLGEEGWELVSNADNQIFLKRPKPGS